MTGRSRRIILLPRSLFVFFLFCFCFLFLFLFFILFFARTPRIRRIVKIYDIVDQFLRKPFWFFLSIFSVLFLTYQKKKALKIYKRKCSPKILGTMGNERTNSLTTFPHEVQPMDILVLAKTYIHQPYADTHQLRCGCRITTSSRCKTM